MGRREGTAAVADRSRTEAPSSVPNARAFGHDRWPAGSPAAHPVPARIASRPFSAWSRRYVGQRVPVRLALRYVENRTSTLVLVIIEKTFLAVLTKRSAF